MCLQSKWLQPPTNTSQNSDHSPPVCPARFAETYSNNIYLPQQILRLADYDKLREVLDNCSFCAPICRKSCKQVAVKELLYVNSTTHYQKTHSKRRGKASCGTRVRILLPTLWRMREDLLRTKCLWEIPDLATKSRRAHKKALYLAELATSKCRIELWKCRNYYIGGQPLRLLPWVLIGR